MSKYGTILRTMMLAGAAAGLFVSGSLVPAAAGDAVPANAQVVDADAGRTLQESLVTRATEGTQALREERLDDAIRILGEVIASNGVPPALLAATHYHRGIAHQKRGRFNEAASDYTTALWLEELPDNIRARAHYNRGTALDNLGQLDRARQDFDVAISLAPDFSPALNNRGNVLRRLGANEAAIADYDRSIELGNPMPHLPHFGRAAAREALGDIEGARADLEQALNLAPEYGPAQKALAALPQPDPLMAAARPVPVEARADIAAPDIAADPVETAALPPLASDPAPAPIPVPVPVPVAAPPAAMAFPVSPQPEAAGRAQRFRLPAPQLPVPAPGATGLSVPGAGGPAVPALQADAVHSPVRRITTSGKGSTSTLIRPATASEAWTTRILPAGSDEVRTLNDAAPVLALRSGETRLAALSPQPLKGLEFPGVPAAEYREAARPPAPEVPAAPERGSTPAASGYAVQIASVGSQAEAETAWKMALERHGATLADRPHLVRRAEIAGKGTFFRLRVGPMASRSAATALCATLKAAGQDCYVAKQ